MCSFEKASDGPARCSFGASSASGSETCVSFSVCCSADVGSACASLFDALYRSGTLHHHVFLLLFICRFWAFLRITPSYSLPSPTKSEIILHRRADILT